MSSDRRRTVVLMMVAISAAAEAGCQQNRAAVVPAAPPVVPVAHPVAREVTDYVDFTGRTEAIHSVDIRPRANGYLVEMPFHEGAEVKKGDLLFVIDPRPYKAQLDQAQGQVDLYRASLKLARVTLARDRAINARSPGSISLQQFDQEQAVVDEAEARVKAFEMSMEIYTLQHEFTKVTSPIDGMISRYYLTRGNLVNQDQTLLTTIVSVDPMYAYFEMDEPTLLRIRRAINEKKVRVPVDGKMSVLMGLQGEEGFPHQGTVNFINNQVNPTTGSILVRGLFPNPKPEDGLRLLSPGMFVRIRLPIGLPHPAVLVADRAIGSDQGTKFVYVLDAKDMVQTRRVRTGSLQEDGLRVIDEGLSPDDRVVVGALQQVRPRLLVEPEPIAMPIPVPGVVVAEPKRKAEATGKTTTKKGEGRPPSKSAGR